MKRLLRKPLFWLTLQLVATFGVLAWAGGLEYTRVPDTPSYLDAIDAEDLSAVLPMPWAGMMTLATHVQPDLLAAAAGPEITATLIGLLLLGVGYLATYLLLVSLVSFPFSRYFVSMTLFLPSALCAQLFVIWQRILPTRD